MKEKIFTFNAKLASAAGCLCLSLCLCVVAFFAYGRMSTAWFSMNDEVTAGGMNISLQAPESVRAVVTMYDVESVSGGSITFSKAGSEAMPEYNALEVNTKYKLMKISVNAPMSLSLTAETSTDYVMNSAKPLLGTTDGKGTDYNNCITSIISLQYFSSIENNTVTPIERDWKKFVESDFSGIIEGGKIELGSGNVSEMYVLIAYDEALINRVFSENIGNSATENKVSYTMDFSFVLTQSANS